eukprot:1151551-Pelagomonas_calceolata.AAC.6
MNTQQVYDDHTLPSTQQPTTSVSLGQTCMAIGSSAWPEMAGIVSGLSNGEHLMDNRLGIAPPIKSTMMG